MAGKPHNKHKHTNSMINEKEVLLFDYKWLIDLFGFVTQKNTVINRVS